MVPTHLALCQLDFFEERDTPKILISAQIRFFLFRFCLFDFFPYLKLPIMVDDPSTPAAPP